MRTIDQVVRRVLAHHTGRDVATIRPWQQLEEDLDLTPLEIVLVALEIEDALEVEIQAEELAGIATVGELASFVSRAARELDRVA